MWQFIVGFMAGHYYSSNKKIFQNNFDKYKHLLIVEYNKNIKKN